jgi:hypothetical protein
MLNKGYKMKADCKNQQKCHKMHAFYYTSGDVTKFPPVTVWSKYTCGVIGYIKKKRYRIITPIHYTIQGQKQKCIINYMNFFKLNSRNYKFINICIYFVGSR